MYPRSARQTPPSMGFSRQEYWRGLPFPSPGDLPSPGIEPAPPALQMGSLPLSHQESPMRILPQYKQMMCPLANASLFISSSAPTTPTSGNHHSTLGFCEPHCFKFHIWVRSCSICLSVSGLFHMMPSRFIHVSHSRCPSFLGLNSIL